jgi:hypothetical protein
MAWTTHAVGLKEAVVLGVVKPYLQAYKQLRLPLL